jgi:hypothetical protein
MDQTSHGVHHRLRPTSLVTVVLLGLLLVPVECSQMRGLHSIFVAPVAAAAAVGGAIPVRPLPEHHLAHHKDMTPVAASAATQLQQAPRDLPTPAKSVAVEHPPTVVLDGMRSTVGRF